MCAQVLDRQLSRGMSASDSAKVIRHGNTLPNSPRGRLANPPLQQIIQRATAILEVALPSEDLSGTRLRAMILPGRARKTLACPGACGLRWERCFNAQRNPRRRGGRLRSKFPENREFNRESAKFRAALRANHILKAAV